MARKRVSENPVVVSAGAAAVPARRKSTTATTKRASRAIAEVSNITEAVPSEVEAVIAVTATAVNNEEIAQLAYSFWVARGYQGGSPEEDWLRAEQQLSALFAK
jgi:Protein of unknown function (DUF2934)